MASPTEKENVGNVPAADISSSSKPPSARPSFSSPDLHALLMVSPPQRGTTTPNLTPTRSPPPPHSERILSAIRTVEKTLDAEVHHVHVLASAGGGTAGKKGVEEEEASSPESDCASPVPPTFPPMNSLRLSGGVYRSPQRSPVRSGRSPAGGMRAAPSPLAGKSLLPLLSTLEEERITADDCGSDTEIERSNGATAESEGLPVEEVDFGIADPVDDESVDAAVPPAATAYRRRIIDDDSSDSDEESAEEEEEPVQIKGSDEMKESGIDFSKFNHHSVDESEAAHESADETAKKDAIAPSKAHRRRIVDSDDESAASEESDASDEGSETCDMHDELENAEATPPDLGLSALTIDDSTFPEEEEASFGGNDDAFSATTVDDSYDELVSVGSDSHNEQDDDESVTCFDACGCWALDEAHKGDLYLADNSDVRWPRIRLPLALYNKLFPHQRIGIQWMASLHRNKIKGGILADDMGLGKTMQTLTYLGSLMRAQTITNALVVCPKSVVRSWEREANLILKNMCVPKASVYAVTSDMSKEKRKRIFSDAFCCSNNAPRLVVTTYGLVSNHITDLKSIANTFEDSHWSYIVLDEGHLIKNRKTKTSLDVRVLASCSNKTRRLLLSGTPIQNNMRELHALFDWAAPQLLGSIQTFMNKYGDPIEEGRQRNASEWTLKKAAEMNGKLKKLLQPYFLQRLKKEEFEDKMPEKKELVVFTQLSAKQRRMYEAYTESVFDDDSFSPLAAISWLKMLCGHPSLVKEAARRYEKCDTSKLVRDSAKLDVLLALLNRLKRSGHRALVFSQSTKMLDIMETAFDGSLSYLRIDGSTAGKSRQMAVDSFNDPLSGIDVMLLSTKAAGIGLTLTGADRAILYDPSFNPAEDAQAVDRCYRIGQTKNVTVYRFIAAGTVEEKMYEKQVHKDGIKRVVLSKDSSTARYFDTSELAELFKLSPEGECSMMDKFNEKSENNAAGSSGKPSFLTKHPSVIGVASHDVLYSSVKVDVDLTSPKSGETPFSRSPFQKAARAAEKQTAAIVEDLTLDTPQTDQMKPLGGLNNKTRQNRVDAKAKRMESKSISVAAVLREADALVAEEKHGKAMSVLLDLVENMDSMDSEEKLALHKKISQAASMLEWL